MQIKKVAVLTLALALLSGLFAPVASARTFKEEMKARGVADSDMDIARALYNNNLLNYKIVLERDLILSEKALKKLTQETVQKYKNYNAYYNAAIIYAMPSEYGDNQVIYNTPNNSLANVKKYAEKALQQVDNVPGMYYVRAFVTLQVAGFYETPFRVTPLRTFVENHTNEARAALADFEKVSQLLPKAAPWLDMADLYEGFGNKKKAQYCRKMDRQYNPSVYALEEQKEEVREELQKLFA